MKKCEVQSIYKRYTRLPGKDGSGVKHKIFLDKYLTKQEKWTVSAPLKCYQKQAEKENGHNPSQWRPIQYYYFKINSDNKKWKRYGWKSKSHHKQSLASPEIP